MADPRSDVLSFGRHGRSRLEAGVSRLFPGQKKPALSWPKAGFFWPEKEPAEPA